MEFTEFERLFMTACEKNHILSLDTQAVQRFYRFTLHLTEVNMHTNLTAIRNIPDIISKHYIDSLLASDFLPQGARVLDLGCGPGFPSVPLAIARPDLQIVGVDSTEKKIYFVQASASQLELTNLSAYAGRAEDIMIRKKLGSFDAVTSRAVARLHVLCELCLPYVKIGGKMLALKASKAAEELAEAQNAIQTLGGGTAICHSRQLILDSSIEPRTLIEIAKEKATPSAYPRAYAAILKKPL